MQEKVLSNEAQIKIIESLIGMPILQGITQSSSEAEEHLLKDMEYTPSLINVPVHMKDLSIPLPQYKTAGSSGCDAQAKIDSPMKLQPLQRVLIPTGLFVEIPLGYEIQIRPRSGASFKTGLTAIFGTIDSDYRGEIKVIVVNLSNEIQTINPEERIAQLVLMKVEKINWVYRDSLEDLVKTERGDGGFGSTGK